MIVIGVSAVWAFGEIRKGTGLPALAVLATVTAWYVGDVFYNDYVGNHVEKFANKAMDDAWWEVALFLVVFLSLISIVHSWVNKGMQRHTSRVILIWQSGIGNPHFQQQITKLFYSCLTVWGVLTVIAVFRLQEEIPYYFFPFLGYRAEPWGRGRVGGELDALLSLASYLQLFIAGAFGLLAALIRNQKNVILAVMGCVLSWPYFLFDRARNPMLAVMLPGLLAWLFLRYRGNLLSKLAILALCFIVLESWFAFVLANRTNSSVAAAFNEKGFSLTPDKEARHEGLNMYEELCWINSFIEDGSYEPNWGARYLAELVNPVPRGLWADKPFIGLDYAKARGHSGGAEEQGGVNTTISTGMIGQGVVNFGRFFGPAFAALLMAIWVAVLARLDLTGDRVGRIPLYVYGLILTFNLGRDITFITLYSFVFGWLLIRGIERLGERRRRKKTPLAQQPLTAQ